MARQQQNREESQAVEPRRGGQMSRLESSPTLSPFGMMRRFSEEMDRIFDRMFEGFDFPSMERYRPLMAQRFSPDVDVFERESKLVITADLPGLAKDEVKVDVTENAVILEGERKYEHEEREEGVYRTERGYGRFYREVPLPEGVKPDTAIATFKNGVLEVTLEAPQLSKARRRVQIQGEEPVPRPGKTAA
jgi:HSP20 family protein